jgi:hypothetical protein
MHRQIGYGELHLVSVGEETCLCVFFIAIARLHNKMCCIASP